MIDAMQAYNPLLLAYIMFHLELYILYADLLPTAALGGAKEAKCE